MKTGIRLKKECSIVKLITSSFILHNIAQSRGDCFEEGINDISEVSREGNQGAEYDAKYEQSRLLTEETEIGP